MDQEFILLGPGAPKNNPITVALDAVTNTSGSYTHTTINNIITQSMKPLQIQCSNPSAFLDEITITTANGSITLTCSNVIGTSNVYVTLMSEEPGTPVTPTQYDMLNAKVTPEVFTISIDPSKSSSVSIVRQSCIKVGNIVSITATFSVSSSVSGYVTPEGGLPKPLVGSDYATGNAMFNSYDGSGLKASITAEGRIYFTDAVSSGTHAHHFVYVCESDEPSTPLTPSQYDVLSERIDSIDDVSTNTLTATTTDTKVTQYEFSYTKRGGTVQIYGSLTANGSTSNWTKNGNIDFYVTGAPAPVMPYTYGVGVAGSNAPFTVYLSRDDGRLRVKNATGAAITGSSGQIFFSITYVTSE